jgi:hypothetical protein
MDASKWFPVEASLGVVGEDCGEESDVGDGDRSDRRIEGSG